MAPLLPALVTNPARSLDPDNVNGSGAPKAAFLGVQQVQVPGAVSANPNPPTALASALFPRLFPIHHRPDRRCLLGYPAERAVIHSETTMRIAASTVLLGAASAASFQQQAQHVLSDGFGRAQDAMKPISDAFADAAARPVESFDEAFQGMSAQAKALWDEIKLLVPNSAFTHPTWFSKPKPHHRRRDWDHVVKGADVQKLWVQGADGESHRQVDGRLETFNLRVKSVDPSKLGVDSVKQFSGYLDDEANDKHLFYCEFQLPAQQQSDHIANPSSRVLRVA